MHVGPAKFDENRCKESPLRGEKSDFWPVSKNNTGSLPLRGYPAGNDRYIRNEIKPVNIKHKVFEGSCGSVYAS